MPCLVPNCLGDLIFEEPYRLQSAQTFKFCELRYYGKYMAIEGMCRDGIKGDAMIMMIAVISLVAAVMMMMPKLTLGRLCAHVGFLFHLRGLRR
jgi:hypothetical protein